MKSIIPTAEDRFLLARAEDLRARAMRGIPGNYSVFLDPRQGMLLMQMLGKSGVQLQLWGGYPDAERCVLAVEPDLVPQPESFPIVCLELNWQQESTLTHRDFLGAFLSLGLKRETLGDILVRPGRAQCFCLPPAAGLILNELHTVGRVSVTVRESLYDEMHFAPRFEVLQGTVASLRLDCVIAMVLHLSREKAVAAVRGKKVQVNGLVSEAPALSLAEQDTFSVRGFGKFRLSEIGGSTKKGRLHITVLKFQ